MTKDPAATAVSSLLVWVRCVAYALAIILLYFLSAGSDAVFVYQGF